MSSLLANNKPQIWRHNLRAEFGFSEVNPVYHRRSVDWRIRLNTLREDGEIFKSGNKKLRIQKYRDTCG